SWPRGGKGPSRERRSRLGGREEKAPRARRGTGALRVGWRRPLALPIPVTCLDFGSAVVLHLPGEPFIEYQLKAQGIRKDDFVCVAGYGDDGPGYLPTKQAYWEGGYEPTVALSAPEGEAMLHAAMTKLLRK